MVLIGNTGVGKTCMTQWLHRNNYCGMVSLKETGCGRWVQALEHPIVIVDNPRNHWLTSDRMTVLNLLAGTPFPVKVHSTTHSNLEPTHALILCNTLPQDFVTELQARTDVVEIKKYDIQMTACNHTIVWDYLSTLGVYLEDDMVPCMCTMWKGKPCRFREKTAKYEYVTINLNIPNIIIYNVTYHSIP